MTKQNYRYRLLVVAFITCCFQFANFGASAQNITTSLSKDSIITKREAPKARARRHRETVPTTKLPKDSVPIIKPASQNDTLTIGKDILTDSLEKVNRENIEIISRPIDLTNKVDSLSAEPKISKKIFIPNSTKATWLAIAFPGGGQIYNRKYWKLPIIYGGFAGCAYALSWNNKMYKDYSQAYRDITDKNDNTNSFEDIFPPNTTYNKEQMTQLIKNRKDSFRRYRDLSIFAFIGVYVISIIDAYVDAELSDFDISPDLSMRVEPTVINNQFHSNQKAVGVQCVLKF